MTTRRRCPSRKRRYPTEIDARIALVSTTIAANRGNTHRHETRAYHCPTCNGWHLTSQPTDDRTSR